MPRGWRGEERGAARGGKEAEPRGGLREPLLDHAAQLLGPSLARQHRIPVLSVPSDLV